MKRRFSNVIDIPKTPGVYKIFFLSRERCYIGSTANLQKRRGDHLSYLRRGKHRNPHLQAAYDKYGVEELHFEIVEHVEKREDILVREQYYLDTLNPHYNVHPMAQSSLGAKRSPEIRAKLSAIHKGRPSRFKGIPHTPERVIRMRERLKGRIPWNKGKPWSEAAKQKMSAAQKGHSPPNKGRKLGRPSHMKGKHHSPEVKAQMLEKHRATQSAKSPEQRAQAIEKRRATMAAKKIKQSKQLPLWDDNPMLE